MLYNSMMFLSNQNFEPFKHISLLFLPQFSPIWLLPVSLWFYELYFLKIQHKERQIASTFLCLVFLHCFGSSWVFSQSTRNANRGGSCVQRFVPLFCELLCFYDIACNVSNFITDFVYFNFLIVSFIRLAKSLSILCFQRLNFQLC